MEFILFVISAIVMVISLIVVVKMMFWLGSKYNGLMLDIDLESKREKRVWRGDVLQ